MSVDDRYFDALYHNSDDPWAMRQRWYEKRKRALLQACLPRQHYGSIFEPGCANGETSALLAEHCDRLLCCDTAPSAVALARERVHTMHHVQVEQWRLPRDWPREQFDLIVLNELCYYLDADDLGQLIDHCQASLKADGQVLACHWRATIEGCPLDGPQVHERLQHGLGMHRLVGHREADFLLDVWSRDAMTVAQHEGLR